MPITVTLPEFVRVSGLSKSTAYRLVKAKELQSVQIGGRRLIVMASYTELVNRLLDGGMNGGKDLSPPLFPIAAGMLRFMMPAVPAPPHGGRGAMAPYIRPSHFVMAQTIGYGLTSGEAVDRPPE